MRTLTSHRVTPAHDAVTILVLEDPAPGQASARYRFSLRGQPYYTDLFFQSGPVRERGVNGITNEALLSIIEDRLRALQLGACACEEHAEALDAVQTALAALHRRTRDRLARGVEGTDQP